MENEELETFARPGIISALQAELENIPDDEFANFFADVVIRYLDKLFNVDKFEIEVDPYIMGDFDVIGYDDNGYEIRQAKMVKWGDTLNLPTDSQIFWLTNFKLYYNDENVMPREGVMFDGYKLKQFLIALLLEQPSLVFPGVKNPEVDIFMNVVCDIHEWGYNEETDEIETDEEEDDDDDEGEEMPF